MIQTIKENASCEIVEKKSKFIANVFYVETEEEAEEKQVMMVNLLEQQEHQSLPFYRKII